MANATSVCSRRKLVIFASELASAIGRHRYQSREETFQRVWLRSHQQSFVFAFALRFQSDVRPILAVSEELLIQFPSLEKEDDPVDFASAVRKVICDMSFKRLYGQILNFLKAKLLKNEKEEQILESAKVIARVTTEVKTLCENEKKLVESAVKEICDKQGINTKEVVKAVESKITKDRGTKLEEKAVQDFEKVKGIEIERPIAPHLFYQDMEYNGIQWSVCGKVDAETEDSVIEVKNRRNRFMCPEYDYIQLQTYLFIRGKSKGVLLERLKGENKETCFEFDHERWEEVTIDLAEFVAELSDAMNMSKQALYGYTSPKKRGHDQVAVVNEQACNQDTDEGQVKKTAVEKVEEATTVIEIQDDNE